MYPLVNSWEKFSGYTHQQDCRVIGYIILNLTKHCQIPFHKAIRFTLKPANPDFSHLLKSLSTFGSIFLSYFAILLGVKWNCIAIVHILLIINIFSFHSSMTYLRSFLYTNYHFISSNYFSICFSVSFFVDLQEFLTQSRYSSLDCYRCHKYILPVCPQSIVSFTELKFLILMESNSSTFSFMVCTLGCPFGRLSLPFTKISYIFFWQLYSFIFSIQVLNLPEAHV